MSGTPPIKPGKVEVDVDMSASAAARAAPTTRADKADDAEPSSRGLSARKALTSDPARATQNALTAYRDETNPTLKSRKLENFIGAVSKNESDIRNEMTAVQSLYDNCSTKDGIETDFPEGYTKDRIWNDLFGPVNDEAAIVAIYDRFGCLPSAIPNNRQSFMTNGFITTCLEIDAMIEQGDDAPTTIDYGLAMRGLIICPPKLEQLKNLEHLGTGGFPLPPEIMARLGLRTLMELNTGGFILPPVIMSQLESLQTLNLSYTNVASLPPEMAQLENLQTVNLSGTPFDVLPVVDEPVYTTAEYLLSPFMASYTDAVAAKEKAVADKKAANMAAREAKVRAFLPEGCRVIFSYNY